MHALYLDHTSAGDRRDATVLEGQRRIGLIVSSVKGSAQSMTVLLNAMADYCLEQAVAHSEELDEPLKRCTGIQNTLVYIQLSCYQGSI